MSIMDEKLIVLMKILLCNIKDLYMEKKKINESNIAMGKS